MEQEPASGGFRFRRAQRLSGRRAYEAVFDARCRKNVGPLLFFARPNELGFNRLGLSVGRRVGQAVVRARIKRLLREAFRLEQHAGPAGYDMVIVVRPHPPMALAAYRQMVSEGKRAVDQEWQRRRRRQAGRGAAEPPAPPDRPDASQATE